MQKKSIMQYKLSIIIPARFEEFLDRTIQDVIEHTTDQTEVIAILDGYLPNPPLGSYGSRVTVIYNPEARGQRAAANQGVKLSNSKYVIKLDSHCAVAPGFDTEMINVMEELGDNTTLIPSMKNLHVFDWVCPDGHRRYQGKSGPCEECGKPTQKDIVWISKNNPTSTSYCFDSEPHFQYFNEFKKRPEGAPDISPSMSIQGSCFMCTREKWFELDICSEEFHSWGQQGIEVACKTWLSGGQVMVNKKTWYAHMFRTKGGDFGFPYENPQSKINENRQLTRDLFFKGTWPKKKYPLSWLLKKFWPVKGWTDEDLRRLISQEGGVSKGIIYYTDSQLDDKIARPVRDQLLKCSQEKGIPIVSSSLKKLDFGVKNIHFPSLDRGYLTMTKQIIAALENSQADIIFFCEHDVLYHPSHFDFIPPDKNTFYYNQNVWLLRTSDGHALHYDVNQLSGLCGYREQLLIHYRERYEYIEKNGYSTQIGFEPMTHKRILWKNWFNFATWKSELPNVDIKHGGNLTGQRWNKDQYRNQQLLTNWTESENWQIPGWDASSLIVLK